jgi:hypothetical protein
MRFEDQPWHRALAEWWPPRCRLRIAKGLDPGGAAIGEHLLDMRYDQLRCGNDRLHGLCAASVLRLSLERDLASRQSTNMGRKKGPEVARAGVA